MLSFSFIVSDGCENTVENATFRQWEVSIMHPILWFMHSPSSDKPNRMKPYLEQQGNRNKSENNNSVRKQTVLFDLILIEEDDSTAA